MAPCNPPLNFVQNGAAGSAFPPPLDPSDVPTADTNPGFGDLASSLLAGQDPATDGSDQIASDAAADADTLDTIGTSMDATLDTILLLLDQAQPQPVDDALGAFAGDQPGAEQLVGEVSGTATPALGSVPLTLPNGAATITFGGSPTTGGVPTAGEPEYVLHLPIIPVSSGTHAVRITNMTGPNPPLVSANQAPVQETVGGRLMWVALITINPAAAGAFTGVLYYSVDVTITGISGTVQRTLPFEVVVQ